MGKRAREDGASASDRPKDKKRKHDSAHKKPTKTSSDKPKDAAQHHSPELLTSPKAPKRPAAPLTAETRSKDPSAPEKTTATTHSDDGANDQSKQQRKSRFIVFVGNLPYSATSESIAEHFSKIHPESIRLITEKPGSTPMPKHVGKGGRPPKGPKSKGFAFLEFSAYDRMTTCLKLYHHSTFEDGKGPARKINCELTAGGGGKSKARAEKVKAKNTKLDEERRQDRLSKQAKQAEAGAGADESQGPNARSSVHPSRRTRVPGA